MAETGGQIMIKVYCDVCKRLLKNDSSNAVNLDFYSYGVSGFSHEEINLCVPCAELVVSTIDELKTEVIAAEDN